MNLKHLWGNEYVEIYHVINRYQDITRILTDNRIELNPQKVCIYKLSGDFFEWVAILDQVVK